MLLVDILAISGCLYFAKKISQKRQAKKTLKPSQFKKMIAQTVSSTQQIMSKNDDEAELNRQIILSAGAMGLITAGALGYPLLTVLSIPAIIYIQIPFILRGSDELFKKRKIGAATLDAIICIVMTALQYFFAIAFFSILYYISRKILLKTEDSSRQSLIDIWGETPRFVWIIQRDVEIEIPFDKLQVGDVIVVNAGETIPIDGIIEKGIGSVDQHILTGEAQPTEKIIGDSVFASTVLLSGRLHIKVNKAGTETIAAKIKHILNNTTDYKSSLQARGEQMTEQAALPTLLLSGITLAALGAPSAVTILLSSFGGQMRVVAPISVLNFLKMASEQSILIKDGRALEALNNVDTIVFDKTGTLTQEQPFVQSIQTCFEYSENDILRYAAAAEYKQKHPIALAILQEAQTRHLELPMIDEASYEVGYGLKVRLDDKLIRVGSIRFMTLENILIPSSIQTLQTKSQEQGASLVYVAVNEQLSGAIELRSTIRKEAKQVIQNLQQRGMNIVIISGDHEKPTQQLAQDLGIEQYFAETLPEHKAELIEQLQKEGKSVCFVGDGINDSIALKKANVSISLRGASTIATDTAQVILMDESLKQLPLLFDLANRLDKNLRNSFMIAITPGVICVGGVYLFHLGVIMTTVIYNISVGLGVTNAMLPKFNRKSISKE
jgi:heavy metal translocating P-type ATPase